MSEKLYTKDSIESLSPLEFTRLRPQVYAGDCSYSTQLLVEIISNAVDEFRLGHGNQIDINIDKDIVTVTDYGQGFLVNELREDGKTVLEAAFSVLNTSGKYREDGTYEGTSLGSFGIGSKITTFLSHWLTVETHRDGQYEKVSFKEGVFEDKTIGSWDKGNGTIVSWQPSEEFFDNTEVDINKIKELLKTTSCLCPNLKIVLNYNGKLNTFYSTRGIDDLVDDLVKDKEIIDNRCEIKSEDGKNKLDFVLTYTSDYSSHIVPYVNTGWTSIGPHISQIKSTITKEFNKFFKDKGWLKKETLSGDDIQEGMYIIFNITTSGVGYDAQVKSTITKINMAPFISIISENLKEWLEYNEKSIKIIAEKAIAAKKAREAAKKAREKAREGAKKDKGLKGKMSLSDKFIDCKSKDPKKRNLLLVEGLSAAGSVIESRNVETDCVYMLRGKTISPLRTAVDKILANQEMSDIINVIGAGFGNDKFDLSKMKFDKIVITSDQDADGMDIELSLITFFFTYMRPLVESGKLYRAVTPLYIITTKKEKIYCYTEEELKDWKEKNDEQYTLQHCKGLGEISASVLKEICFEHQRFKRITVSDADKTVELLNVLEGSDADLRKKYIYENATELGFNFM